VLLRDGEDFDRALKRFTKKCERDGVLTELRKRRFYEKPSIKKRRKSIESIKKRNYLKKKGL
jgi:small subunit ribosomal protein S21